MKMSENKDGLVIEIFVKPNSQKFEVTIEDDTLVVRCTEEPVKGKVNKEIIKDLSKLFHSRVEIVSGATSKHKVVLVRGAKKNEIEHLLK